jgi:hypothetical protein
MIPPQNDTHQHDIQGNDRQQREIIPNDQKKNGTWQSGNQLNNTQKKDTHQYVMKLNDI